LTPFATAFRYPGDVLESERSDVEDGMELAGLVSDLVLRRMPDEVRQQGEGAGKKYIRPLFRPFSFCAGETCCQNRTRGGSHTRTELFARLRRQFPTGQRRWTRDELYD